MWKSFNKGDKVYVYFPRLKAKQEHHLSSILQELYKVIEKCLNGTCKVNCGTYQVLTYRYNPTSCEILKS